VNEELGAEMRRVAAPVLGSQRGYRSGLSLCYYGRVSPIAWWQGGGRHGASLYSGLHRRGSEIESDTGSGNGRLFHRNTPHEHA